jgi:hypothetical protein
MDMSSLSETRAGTLGGTLLVLLCSLKPAQILETAVLAAVGAGVSFVVSFALKALLKKVKKG